MNNIFISVIVPIYDAEKYLNDCVKSLINQTLEEIEIILVNDGSTDNSQKIIEELSNKYPEKIRYFYQENSGPSAARNLGIKYAKGKFIGFIDADDELEPNMYKEMYDKALEVKAELVECGRKYIYNYGQGNQEKVVLPKQEIYNSDIFSCPRLISETSLFVWDKIFRKDIIERYNLYFDERYSYAEDCLFISKYKYYCTNIASVQQPLYNYKIKLSNSITGTINERILDVPKALNDIILFYMEKGYWDYFRNEFEKVFVGYYVRKIRDFTQDSNKYIQKKYVTSFLEFLNKYFYNWEKVMRWYGARKKKYNYRLNFYKCNKSMMYMYIHCPNILIKLLHSSISLVKKLKKKVKYFKKRLPSCYYAYCCKKYKIDKNTILFISYFGSSISDSMYYMMEDIVNNDNYKVYIGSNNERRENVFLDFNSVNPKVVRIGSREYIKLLATANYLVINSRVPSYFSKRDGQTYLNTWHGTPLKCLGKRMNKGLKDVGNNQGQFLMADYLLYPNEYTQKHMMDDFFLNDLYTGKSVVGGYPRNSIFFEQDYIQKTKKILNLEGKKIYAYMPTWRGDTLDTRNIDKYRDELINMLNYIDENLSDDTILFVKLHQLVMRKIKISNYKHIKLFHQQYETYKFLNIADCLITDYSSVFYDFANTKKEIILFTYDYEDYMNNRGVYMNMSELPFRRINDVKELVTYLNKNKPNEFTINDSYKEFINTYCKYDSKDAPKIINNMILNNKFDSNKMLLTDCTYNKEKSHTVIFMQDLKESKYYDIFLKLVKENNKNTIFVFNQPNFSNVTSEVLAQYSNNEIKYIVAPGDMPFTISEGAFLYIYRKTKLFKWVVKKVYKREIQRILPNIGVEKFVNYSNYPKFIDIEKIFRKK